MEERIKNADLIARLRAAGHHQEGDQIERKEIVADLRAGGNHQLADQIEAAHRPPGRTVFAEAGCFDPDALLGSRADDLARLAQKVEDDVNASPRQ